MAIKGLTSNLSSVRENRSRLIIGAVTLAAGLGRYVVVHGCGSDRGNGDKRWGGRTGFLTGCQSWTMSSFFPSRRSLPRRPTVSSTSLAAVFSYLLKILHHLKPFPLCDFQCCAAALPEKKRTERISHRWWITISTVLSSGIYTHFKVRKYSLICSLVSCSILFVSVIAEDYKLCCRVTIDHVYVASFWSSWLTLCIDTHLLTLLIFSIWQVSLERHRNVSVQIHDLPYRTTQFPTVLLNWQNLNLFLKELSTKKIKMQSLPIRLDADGMSGEVS